MYWPVFFLFSTRLFFFSLSTRIWRDRKRFARESLHVSLEPSRARLRVDIERALIHTFRRLNMRIHTLRMFSKVLRFVNVVDIVLCSHDSWTTHTLRFTTYIFLSLSFSHDSFHRLPPAQKKNRCFSTPPEQSSMENVGIFINFIYITLRLRLMCDWNNPLHCPSSWIHTTWWILHNFGDRNKN